MNRLLRLKNLTIFDRLLIALIVFGGLFLFYLFFRESSYLTITVKVGEDNVRYLDLGSRVWFSELFYEGMQEKDGFGRVNSEVLKVFSYNTSPTTRAVYLTLKIKGVLSRAQNQYTYKGNPILIGRPIKIFLDKVLVDGLITNIEGVEDPREKHILIVEAKVVDENPTYLETSGVQDYLAAAINNGDEVADNNGETIIKILSKRVENAKKAVTTSDGRVILQTQPMRKDVYLTLEINAISISDKYFVFDDVPILVGSIIPINSSSYSIRPVVTSIRLK